MGTTAAETGDAPGGPAGAPGLGEVARQWGRIGVVGFGGPPAHITLLRELCVDRRRWIDPVRFEDAIAAVNLLPGPASTQLAIYCAWRLRGALGAILILGIGGGVLSSLFDIADPRVQSGWSVLNLTVAFLLMLLLASLAVRGIAGLITVIRNDA